MATTKNSRFLTVSQPPPSLATGWSLHILDYKDMTSLVAVCQEFSQLSFTKELNGTGNGSVTLDADSPWWSNILDNGLSNRSLMDNEYVFECWEDGVCRFAFLAQTVVSSVIAEDESRTVTISGPGIAQVLTWATINRPGWPTKPPTVGHFTDNDKKVHPIPRSYSPSDKLPAFLWEFPLKWTTMRMWYTVFRAAQRRGLIKWVTPTFTALKDSAKEDFIFVNTLTEVAEQTGYRPENLAEHLLDFLNECSGQDYSKWFGQRLDWIMHPGFKLQVQKHIGVNRSKEVRFFGGQIISHERTRDREAIYNRVIAVDVDGDETIRLNKKSVTEWNLREQRNETNKNVVDAKLRDQIADRYIIQSKDEKDEWAIKVPYDDKGRVPFINFDVGDDIGVLDDHVGLTPANTGAPIQYRVLAITVSLSNDQQVPDCELTLRSMIDAKMMEIEKKITQIINEPVVVSIGNIKEISIPGDPKNKKILVYNPVTKKWEAKDQPATTTTDPTGGTGSGSIFVQRVNPATQAHVTVNAGDFWLETYE